MDSYNKVLERNKEWVRQRTEHQPDFFQELAQSQKPEFFWIGCSDSRVPAEQITGLEPGELFVHRNIANLAPKGDVNVLSGLQFAVEALKVKHVIVCGHYGCGGIKYGMTEENMGLLDAWLEYIRILYRENQAELDTITDPIQRADRMAEINVLRQIRNIAASSIVQQAWKRDRYPEIHGWVYDMRTGYLKELETIRVDGGSDLYRN